MLINLSYLRRFSNLILSPIFLIVVLTSTANSAEGVKNSSLLRHDSSVNSKSSTHKILNQLSLNTDLWHVAVIRGEDDKALGYQQVLATIIRTDVMASEQLVRKLARRTAIAGISLMNSDSGDKITKKRKAKRALVSEAFTRNLRLLRAKAKVLQSIDRNQLSANTYKLLARYMDILRRQIGLEKVWLVTTGYLPNSRDVN